MSKKTPGKDTEVSSGPVKELTLKQQEELIKEEIQRFVKIAKERGSIAIEELNELLQENRANMTVLTSRRS